MKDYKIALVVAIILHVIFLGALFFNWQVEKQRKIVLKQGDIIQVSAVDANSYDAEIKKIEQQKKAEQDRQAAAKREAEKKRQQKLEKKREQAERRAREKKRQAEEAKARQQAEEQKRQEIQARKKAEKLAAEKREAEKKAAEKREAEKREAEKKAAEKEKRQQEEARRREQERKAEQQRQAEEKRRKAAEQQRQAELKRQEEREREELERKSQGIINRHVALIVQKIERNWRQPLNVPAGLTCRIEIRLTSTGEVLNFSVIETSGNRAFDKSVETAVFKASPLPVPTESYLFQEFKVMRVRFEPGSY